VPSSNERERKRYAEDPEFRERKKAASRRYELSRRYGITQDQYNAFVAKQKAACVICREKSDRTLCLDHSHATGKVRGLLCRQCNVGLGCYRDKPGRLFTTIKYVEASVAIENYSQLKTAIEDWLDHSLFTARIPEFIALFEATANRRLRVRQMEASAALTPSSGAVALPADYLAWRRVTWTGSSRVELQYVHPSYLQAAYPSSPSNTPRIFTIEGSTLKVRPVDDTALEFDYVQKVPALSESTATNWLLSTHPDLYLYGSLVEAEMFGVNDDRVLLWTARRDRILGEIETLSNKTRGAGAIRVMGATP
jgi:hypothetical protein